MSNLFYFSEILDIAVQQERKRVFFYDHASKKMRNKSLQQVFERCKLWEEGHIKMLENMKSTLRGKETSESYPGELKAYIDVVISQKLCDVDSPEEFDKRFRTTRSIIEHGMQFAKDAILLFHEFLKYTQFYDKEIMQKIIDEEKEQIVCLSQIETPVKKREG